MIDKVFKMITFFSKFEWEVVEKGRKMAGNRRDFYDRGNRVLATARHANKPFLPARGLGVLPQLLP